MDAAEFASRWSTQQVIAQLVREQLHKQAEGPPAGSGAAGPQGATGPAGADGAVGPTGPQGPAGNDGAKGPQGIQGPPGNDGAAGATGSTGPQGNTGPEGPEGPQGPQGDAGAPGADGNDGADGATGSQGIQGIQGIQGVQGDAGATGPSGVTKAASTTVAAGADATWLCLAANSGDITGTGLVTVMSITGVGVGRYAFRCMLVYQTTATTTGMGVAVNHTGTLTQFAVQRTVATTGGAAATNAATGVGATSTGNLAEMQSSRTKDALIGAVTVSVDAQNADMIALIEGFFVVSVTGTLEIKLRAEAAALVVRAMQGSNLELRRLS